MNSRARRRGWEVCVSCSTVSPPPSPVRVTQTSPVAKAKHLFLVFFFFFFFSFSFSCFLVSFCSKGSYMNLRLFKLFCSLDLVNGDAGCGMETLTNVSLSIYCFIYRLPPFLLLDLLLWAIWPCAGGGMVGTNLGIKNWTSMLVASSIVLRDLVGKVFFRGIDCGFFIFFSVCSSCTPALDLKTVRIC